MLTEIDLLQFTGSETLYRHNFCNFNYTEGVRYLAQKAQAHWLIDIIFSWQIDDNICKEKFQSWSLTVDNNYRAILRATDGNDREIASQDIEYTDFPLKTISFYLCDYILMLPSEY